MKIRARVTGHVYDLPEVRARALVKTGIYEAVREAPAAKAATPEAASLRARVEHQDSPPAPASRRKKAAE